MDFVTQGVEGGGGGLISRRLEGERSLTHGASGSLYIDGLFSPLKRQQIKYSTVRHLQGGFTSSPEAGERI